MIQGAKRVEDYVSEFVLGVMTNDPFPDLQIVTEVRNEEGDPTPPEDTNELQTLRSMLTFIRNAVRGRTKTGLNGQQLPFFGRLISYEIYKMYISPIFPNNLILPNDLENYENKKDLQAMLILKTTEIRNQFGIVCDRRIERRGIYCWTYKELEAMQSRLYDFLTEIKIDWDRGNFRQDLFGYPIIYKGI